MKYIFPRSLCIFAKYKLRARPNKSQSRKNNAIERDLSRRIPLGQSRLSPFVRFFFFFFTLPEESVSDQGDRSIMLLKSTLSAGRISELAIFPRKAELAGVQLDSALVGDRGPISLSPATKTG